MTYQASDFKRNYFLDSLDNDYSPIKPTYMKSRSQLKLLDYLNSLYVRVTRAITNHTPIGKYQLRFFSKENFSCLYKSYPIETKGHILHECRRFNNYWNLNRNLLSYFIAFLKFNPRAFCFMKRSLDNGLTIINTL